MIKNIVFDVGDVLHYFTPAIYANRLGFFGEEARLLVQEVFCSSEWCATDSGRLSHEAAARIIAPRLPEHLRSAVEPLTCSWWQGEIVPVPGMAELVKELKNMGYGIYMLSNASRNIYKYMDRIPGTEYFDGKLISADVLLLKPWPEIYQKLYSMFELTPSECFFIDDMPANIEAAKYTGMSGSVFRNDVARLRRELYENGITVKQL